MRSIKLLTTFLMMVYSSVNAQKILEGMLVNDEQPIPYVNIGVAEANVGTVSDKSGYFILVLPDSLMDYTIQISHVSYIPIKIKAEKLAILLTKEKGRIILQENVFELEEVEILQKKMKSKTLGDHSIDTTFSITYGDSLNLGQELGRRFDTRNGKRFFVNAVDFTLKKNEYDTLPMRLNIYEVENNLPGKSILKENIIFNVNNKTKKVHIDMTEYEIWYDKDFFITIEVIEPVNPNKFEFLAGIFEENKIVQRQTSLGYWHVISGLGLAISISIVQ